MPAPVIPTQPRAENPRRAINDTRCGSRVGPACRDGDRADAADRAFR
ncbi:hypothetical protein SCATT_p13070 (plasmid) [Streptantibioticus cattleyicolor NRRL 8057 = DSM 46488]|uniref:Uncharacterized protein n=1 Tax=Streptantibioticus cattleyicolor (strain ATCC 35852 / DSM 46488 / JCM 4925 / NBRC 14057 / NRRL 8057) TaxID=1003195 RepID=G8XFP0_STREN|nr:hypothetical protein SCATT_p13070 [Streptantibioticus cattleyicolor NRRL 8057 = DSM 46488]